MVLSRWNWSLYRDKTMVTFSLSSDENEKLEARSIDDDVIALYCAVCKESYQKRRYLLILHWHNLCQLTLWWCRDLCCDLCSSLVGCRNSFAWNWIWQPRKNGVSSRICVDPAQIIRTEWIWDKLRSNALESLSRIHLKRAHKFRSETN